MKNFNLTEAFKALNKKPNKLTESAVVEEVESEEAIAAKVINDPAMAAFTDNGYTLDPAGAMVDVEEDGTTLIYVGITSDVTVPAFWSNPVDAEDMPAANSDLELDEDISTIANDIEEDLKAKVQLPITLADGREVVDFGINSDDFEIELDQITDYSVDSQEDIDAGIGGYEYWGDNGNDSQPLTQYNGTITTSITTTLIIKIK